MIEVTHHSLTHPAVLLIEDEPRYRDGPNMLVQLRRGDRFHARPRFRAEILDDDLLDVPISFVQAANFQERFYSFATGLADAYQDSRRKRHSAFP